MSFKFKNGEKVIEKITDIEGIITGQGVFLDGTTQYLLEWVDKNGVSNSKWYDEARLELSS